MGNYRLMPKITARLVAFVTHTQLHTDTSISSNVVAGDYLKHKPTHIHIHTQNMGNFVLNGALCQSFNATL